jgi:hypothetical protein
MTFFQGTGRSIAVLFLLLVCASASASATQYWELSPASDPRIAIGTYTMVGGKTSPEGVNFTLKNNSANQPVALTLIATTPAAHLHLSAFKDDGQSCLDKDTDAKGLLTIKFRTADTMNFKVTGPVGSAYQLSLWRGPAIALPQPDSVVAMDAVIGHSENAAAPVPIADAGARASPAKGASGADIAPVAASTVGSNLLIYILLAGIMIVLIVIAVLLHRGQQMRGKS